MNALTGILGEYARTAPMETFMASATERHPTDLAGLFGARLVVANETEVGRRWAESKLKTLTGGDTISARFMRQDFFDFVPAFKLFVVGNHRPHFRSVDEAIRRRLHLLPRRLGISEKTIMKIGGWKTSAMFQRYDIVDQADLDHAARMLDQKRRRRSGRREKYKPVRPAGPRTQDYSSTRMTA